MEFFEGSAACTDFVGLGSDRLCLKLGHVLGHDKEDCVSQKTHKMCFIT